MTTTNDAQAGKVVYSALKPTGELTLGNYIGALKTMAALTQRHPCYYTVADLHALTVDNVPAELRRRSLDFAALFIAAGLSPDRATIFIQSHVRQHAELAWALNCYTQFGEARRMTQFKDKSAKAPQNVNVGLFAYPTLMAADILLYQADYVPVGKDQQQHVELARTVAERFNNRYSPTFTLPECLFPKEGGAKIYSLTEPTGKMGKTESDENGTVFLLDTEDAVMKKFKRAVTDSDGEIRFDRANKPGVSNLLTIYSALSGKTVGEAEAALAGAGYAALKETVGQCVAAALRPIQDTYKTLIADKTGLETILKEGAQKASYAAAKTLNKVYKKVGLLQL
ncbi:MAG: tryptophan--tRNA ligase [Clostridiales bacterium]|jgi:tryptophanyl-tRNA synthetase|nr:tryptophan--tRNA ligase [Clostridiales bacterium]